MKHGNQERRQIIKIQKQLGYFKSSNPAKNLSLSPTAMKKLGIRIARKGIHEARKIKSFADFIDSSKQKIYMRKSVKHKVAAFEKHNDYEVSIVIPVYNKISYTLNCLASISSVVSKDLKYQVIVIDNGSTDGTDIELKKIEGLTYIKNKENLGFVDACNQGAKLSKAKYLVFLNNDTSVQEGWLENLLYTIKQEKVGLVGSKLIYPTRRLQEAGGIIFNDASGYNYGRRDWPHQYQYNYLKEVDYCSGASIIINRNLFNKVGCFDRLYAPAYYEDTDLAFNIRKAGYKVIYQPKSIVYHLEGGTAGTDLSSGFKKYQSINKVKFEKKWQKELSKQFSSNDVYLARDRSYGKLALIIDENIPKPDEDSGSVRMFRILESLKDMGYKVTFFPYNTTYYQKYAEPLQQRGIEVVYGNVKVSEYIKQSGKYFDIVMLSRPRIASLFMDLCREYCKKAKIIYDTVDLHYLRLNRQAEFTKHPKQLKSHAGKHEILEKYLIKKADLAYVVGDYEKKLLNKDGYKNVEVLSNIHVINEDAYKISFTGRKDLLFVGGYAHPPNIDAISWFVNEIFPLIREEIPDIKINVVGSHMPKELKKELENKPGVVVHGFVENLEPLLKKARVFVAPIRYGAGVKGKIGQAIEYGIPVVSTTTGAEGMHLKNNVSCLVADDTKEFANSVVKLYGHYSIWIKITRSSKKVLESNFSPKIIAKTLSNIII